MIFIFGISISLFLMVLLFFKKEKSKADKVLIFWLFVIAVHQSLFYLDYSNEILSYGFLIGLIIPFPYLHGPFLYIYTSLLTKPLNKSNRHNWIHFVPFVSVNIYLIKFYFLKNFISYLSFEDYFNLGNNFKKKKSF